MKRQGENYPYGYVLKKVGICIAISSLILMICGWEDTKAIARAEDEDTAVRTISVLPRSQNKPEITAAVVTSTPDLEIEKLSIIERDMEKAYEEEGQRLHRNGVEEHSDKADSDQLQSERDLLDETDTVLAGERTGTEVREASPEDSEDGITDEVSEPEGIGTGEGEPGTDGTAENIGVPTESYNDIDLSESISDMGDGERTDDSTDSDSEYESGLIYLGDWCSTGYCPCSICCGQWATGYTASGTLATEGRTVACGSLPMGTEIYIEGYGYRVVEDLGVYGEWVDIFYSSHEAASAHGLQYVSVYLVN